MASKSADTFCGICSRRSLSTKAEKYCTDCEDALCSECSDYHGNIKTFNTHHMIDIDVIEGKPLVVNKSCKVHPDMVLEYFCTDHDTTCCRSCMASAHRSCEKLLPIEVSAKGVKSSAKYEEIEKELTSLNSAVNELEDKKRQSIVNLKDSKLAVQQDVRNIKERLKKHIQEIEADLISEIDKIHTDISNDANENLEKICDRRRNIQNIVKQFESVSKHGSEIQIFMLINNIKEELNCRSIDFKKLLSSQKDITLSLKESDLISLIKSFGSVDIKEAILDVKYQPCKIQQAQLLQQQKKLPPTFVRDVRFSVPYTNLVGIGVTKDNRLFVCNHCNSSLCVMSEKGRLLDTVQMDGKQWGIAMEEEKNTAWVTLPQMQSVQALDMLLMKKGRLIKVPSYHSHVYVYSIAIIDEQIAVGGIGKIYIISKTGDLKKTLEVGKGQVRSISVGHTHQLYYAQAETGKSILKSVTLDGKIAIICAEGIENMTDCKSDKIGNVYILDSQSSSLKWFSFEDKSVKTILTSKDGLKGPYGLAFSKDFSKLFISNCTAGEIFVFLCNQK